MEIFAIIVVGVFIICSGVAVFFMLRSARTLKRRDDIHFIGGADTNRGYISYDNNFFKGTGSYQHETVAIGMSASLKPITFTVNGSAPVTAPMRGGQLILGRENAEGVYAVADRSVSKRHCRLYRYSGGLYLEDLNSSNHTYLNGSYVGSAVPVKAGDVIRIGSTQITIQP